MVELLAIAKETAKDYLESRRWPSRPQTINFEITAACDARCIHCPRHEMDRPMKAMSLDLFRRMIDQASELQVPYLCPNGYGEICVIPMNLLRQYFDYMATQPRRFKVLINTNGNRMDAERSALFIEHGVHLVNVTIDGATRETAESIRKNLKFDQIEANIKRLLAMRNAAGKKYPKVRVGMVKMPQTTPEIGPFLTRWKGIADFVGIGNFSTRLGSVTEGPVNPSTATQSGLSGPGPQAWACVLPFRDMDIWADGKAVLCCQDWNEEFVVGDLNTQTLHEIWQGPQMTEVRSKHMARLGHEVGLCAKCNYWEPTTAGVRLWA